jgi:hypothetical protein
LITNSFSAAFSAGEFAPPCDFNTRVVAGDEISICRVHDALAYNRSKCFQVVMDEATRTDPAEVASVELNVVVTKPDGSKVAYEFAHIDTNDRLRPGAFGAALATQEPEPQTFRHGYTERRLQVHPSTTYVGLTIRGVLKPTDPSGNLWVMRLTDPPPPKKWIDAFTPPCEHGPRHKTAAKGRECKERRVAKGTELARTAMKLAKED